MDRSNLANGTAWDFGCVKDGPCLRCRRMLGIPGHLEELECLLLPLSDRPGLLQFPLVDMRRFSLSGARFR